MEVQFRGHTYPVGTPGTPLTLDMIAPARLPPDWQEVATGGWVPSRQYGRAYVARHGLRVLLSASLWERRRWLHVSVTHRGGRLPTWREMCEVKTVFCGSDRTAYQIHPPAAKHVSLHPTCLHLFCPLDGAVTPDFTGGGSTL